MGIGRDLFSIMCLLVLVFGSSRTLAADTGASPSSEVRPLSWEVFSPFKVIGGLCSNSRGFVGGYVLGENRSLLRSRGYSRLGAGGALAGGMQWGPHRGEEERRLTLCLLPLRLYHVFRIQQEEDLVGFTWAFVEWTPLARSFVREPGGGESGRSGWWVKGGVAMEVPGAFTGWGGNGLEAGIMLIPSLDGRRSDQFFYVQASFDLGTSKLKGSE